MDAAKQKYVTTSRISVPHEDRRATASRRARNAGRLGFTLIELMLVISILGLMAVIASPSFFSMRERARYAGCVLKQRQIHEVAVLYAAENDPGSVTIPVLTLTAADYITENAAECPSSNIENFNDFKIVYVASAVDALICDVMGADHLYTP